MFRRNVFVKQRNTIFSWVWRKKKRGKWSFKVKDSTVSRESGPTLESRYLWCLLTDLSEKLWKKNFDRKSNVWLRCVKISGQSEQNCPKKWLVFGEPTLLLSWDSGWSIATPILPRENFFFGAFFLVTAEFSGKVFFGFFSVKKWKKSRFFGLVQIVWAKAILC